MAKGRLSKTKTTGHDVRVPIDAKLKKLWDESHRAMVEAQGEGAKAFDTLWEAVERIVAHEPPLWVAGGFGNAAEFYKATVGETERTAQRNIRVAHFASAEQEQAFGVSKLDAALGYLEAKNGGPLSSKVPIAFERLKIPVKTAGGVANKRLADASVPEVRAAAALVSKKPAKKKESETARAVGVELAGVKALATVATTEHADTLSFRNVPIAALAEFAVALGRAAKPKRIAAPKATKKRR